MIDELVKKAADSKSDSDYNSFFQEVKDEELFFSVSKNNEETTVPLALIGDDLRAVIFFTTQDDKRLNDNFGGIEWEKGLEMVLKMPDADGLVVQSSSDAWIAVKKNTIEELLLSYSANDKS